MSGSRKPTRRHGQHGRVFLAALLSVVPSGPAVAQRVPIPLDSVRLGAIVRVRTAERDSKGTLLSRTPTVVEVRPGFDIKTARTQDTTFAVIRGQLLDGAVRTGSRWRSGALIGTIGLGIAGGVLGCLSSCGDPEIDNVTVAYGAVGGALAGAILGGLAGHFIKVWSPLDRLSLGTSVSH